LTITFDNKVAIVTGAGNGLGKAHALALADRGARVVVNDLGGDVHGEGGSLSPAQQVVEEIIAGGGEAFANGANVADYEQVQQMVADTMERWGRVDILINNAGILRDKSFSKMSIEDFRLVLEVHLMGSVNCSKAVWDIMKEQNYGRIMMTTSSSGLYGNFGQANYGAAKMGVVGLMNTLCLEGAKYNIKINALAPVAGTRMTEGLIPEEAFALLSPASVSTGVMFLVSEDAPTKVILGAGAGSFARAIIVETAGANLSPEELSPENLAEIFPEVDDREGTDEPAAGFEQTIKFINLANE
jgi:NAD(P)-dependent dehydrogenase (short-subunit alcohol dehydrogenase family)